MRDALALLSEEFRNVHSIRVYRGSLSAKVLIPETHYLSGRSFCGINWFALCSEMIELGAKSVHLLLGIFTFLCCW